MRRHLAVLTFLLLLVPGLGFAGDKIKDVGSDPIERTMAEELLTMTDVKASLKVAREQFAKLIEAQVSSFDLPDDESERLSKFQNDIMDLVFDEMSWENLKDRYVDVYVSVFTQEELGGLIAFYRSPIGQALLSKTPELMKGMLEVAQEEALALQPRIMQMMDDLKAEMDAEIEAELDMEMEEEPE